MKKRMKKQLRAFTLIEMLIVLGIIAVLILLFIPNITQHQESINKNGNEATEQVVETQKELYRMEHGKDASIAELVKSDYLTQKQADKWEKLQAAKEPKP